MIIIQNHQTYTVVKTNVYNTTMSKLVNQNKDLSVMDYYEYLMERNTEAKREFDIVSKDLKSLNSELNICKHKFLVHVTDRHAYEAEEANDEIESLMEKRELLLETSNSLIERRKSITEMCKWLIKRREWLIKRRGSIVDMRGLLLKQKSLGSEHLIGHIDKIDNNIRKIDRLIRSGNGDTVMKPTPDV